jgi:hypothetical protein
MGGWIVMNHLEKELIPLEPILKSSEPAVVKDAASSHHHCVGNLPLQYRPA